MLSDDSSAYVNVTDFNSAKNAVTEKNITPNSKTTIAITTGSLPLTDLQRKIRRAESISLEKSSKSR